MAWRSNAPPEPTVRELLQYVKALEGRIAALEGKGGGWLTMGDTASRFRRDALTPPMSMQQPMMFKPPTAPPPRSWDVRTAVQASIASGGMLALASSSLAVAGVLPWFTPFVVFSVAAPVSFYLVALIPKSTMNLLERKAGIDINGDGNVGEPPEAEPRVITLEVSSFNKDGRLAGIKNLSFSDISEDTLMEFLGAIANGLPLTGPSWQGRAGSLSQSKFAAVMRELERAGYVENKRGNVGRVLTDTGAITLRFLVAPNPLPRSHASRKNE